MSLQTATVLPSLTSQAPGTRVSTPLGELTLEPLSRDPNTIALLHGWLTHPRSRFWGMQGWSLEQVDEAFAEIAASGWQRAWLGRLDVEPCFLAETYDPSRHELSVHLDVGPTDLGMHLLVAPPDGPPVRGLTTWVMHAVMAHCFADPDVERVVVEPDAANVAVHAKNAEAGFRVVADAPLSDKIARLSVCSRSSWEAHRRLLRLPGVDSTAHLNPQAIAPAHRTLAVKALAELAHERVITPEPIDGDTYAVGDWRFGARVLPLEHWLIDPESVVRLVDGTETQPDAVRLVLDLADDLGVPDELMPTYLQELNATLAAAAFKQSRATPEAAALVDASLYDVEWSMTEGHPGFIANSGRTGLGVSDLHRYAPESGRPVALRWVAVRRDRSELTLSRTRTEAEHVAEQVGERDAQRFVEAVCAAGGDPADYRLMPVHPWQWEHQVCTSFAAEVAAGVLIDVGPTSDRFQAQQSIRTFGNLDVPERGYVKTALAVQNMGFVRGLSARYMRATPAINDWVADLMAGDDALRANGVDMLREHTAVAVVDHAYDALPGVVPHQKMLAALWRESPFGKLRPGENAATLAAVLHRDQEGRSLATAWIVRSGLTPADWVRRLARAYVWPLVHCLTEHGLAFMPHGENVILVLRGGVPERVILKDIGEEVAVYHDDPLPELVERVRADVSPHRQGLAIQTDVFDGVLRHLAAILDADGLLRASEFWGVVGDVVREHRDAYPRGHERVDLLAPRFEHSCLNRLQLRNALQMVDLADLDGSLMMAGTLANPIA